MNPASGGQGWQRGAIAVAVLALAVAAPNNLAAQDTTAVRAVNDSVSVRFVDADLRGVIQALGRYLSKPVLVGAVQPVRVSLETPGPVPRAGVRELLKGLVEAQGLEFTEDSTFFRIGPKLQVAAPAALDSAVAAQRAVELFVIRLRHARSSDVAATVNLLFGGGGEFASRGGLSGGTLSDELRRNLVPPGMPAPAAAQPVAGAGGPTRLATLLGPVTIVPDELTNVLLIRATQADYDLIKRVVDQLDIRPLQVLIEVLIVEVQRNRDFTLGSLLEATRVDGRDTYHGSIGAESSGDIVVQFMRLGRTEINAALAAAQSRGDVEIVSRPILLASNNTEAHFLVGSQRPFVQVSRSLPTDTPSRDQIVQYRDVGTKLTIRPTINEDGYVSLLLQQEISAATSETEFDAPVISTREARTQVLVRDSQTIVLGGLKDRQRERTQTGVPVLSGIPIIGGLFGSASRRSSSTELYLFLTPRIIRTDAEADSLTRARMPTIKPPDD